MVVFLIRFKAAEQSVAAASFHATMASEEHCDPARRFHATWLLRFFASCLNSDIFSKELVCSQKRLLSTAKHCRVSFSAHSTQCSPAATSPCLAVTSRAEPLILRWPRGTTASRRHWNTPTWLQLVPPSLCKEQRPAEPRGAGGVELWFEALAGALP